MPAAWCQQESLPWLRLCPCRAAWVTAALARAFCCDSEEDLLGWDKHSIAVNLSCSVVQNDLTQNRVPSCSYAMSSTRSCVVSVSWVTLSATSKTTGNHLLYTVSVRKCPLISGHFTFLLRTSRISQPGLGAHARVPCRAQPFLPQLCLYLFLKA